MQPLSASLKAGLSTLPGRLFMASAVLLILSTALLATVFATVTASYQDSIKCALAESPPNHAAALTYQRGRDFAIARTLAVFAGLGLGSLGSMYVLRTAKAAYNMKVDASSTLRAQLSSTSPGLVIVTLGSALVVVGLLKGSSLQYGAALDASASSSPPPAQNQTAAPPLPQPMPLGLKKAWQHYAKAGKVQNPAAAKQTYAQAGDQFAHACDFGFDSPEILYAAAYSYAKAGDPHSSTNFLLRAALAASPFKTNVQPILAWAQKELAPGPERTMRKQRQGGSYHTSQGAREETYPPLPTSVQVAAPVCPQ